MSIARRFAKAVETRWYSHPGLLLLLTPLEYLYRYLALRKKRRTHALTVAAPVVVVGNLTVGGVGKTPIVIALVKELRSRGLRPGVVSRGYGRQKDGLELVASASTPQEVGDEPLLIYQCTACPVAVAADRVMAARALLSQSDCNIIIADDGFQHHRLGRDLNIVVVDGSRYFGNGHCLPVGPLREPPKRLAEVKWLIQTGTEKSGGTASLYYHSLLEHYKLKPIKTTLEPVALCNLITGKRLPPGDLAYLHPFTAVAGIGSPEKFFSSLRDLLKKNDAATDFKTKAFADHHHFLENDVIDLDGNTIVMTAKDATKCRAFAKDNWWYLDVEVSLPKIVVDSVSALVCAAPEGAISSANCKSLNHERNQETNPQ